MLGKFHSYEEWMNLLDKKDDKQLSEGAQWWLSRIAARQSSG